MGLTRPSFLKVWALALIHLLVWLMDDEATHAHVRRHFQSGLGLIKANFLNVHETEI